MILSANTRIPKTMRIAVVCLATSLMLGGCQLFETAAPAHGQAGASLVTQPKRLPAPPAGDSIGARENPRVVAEYGGVYSDPEVEAGARRASSRASSPHPTTRRGTTRSPS